MRTRAGASSYATCLADFLEALRVARFSEATVRQARHVLPWLFQHLSEKGVRDVRGVREEHLVSFARTLAMSTTRRGTPYALATQRVYLKRVRHFFHHLVRRGMLLVNPAQHLALPHAVRLPKLVLSESEAGRLMTAPFPYSPVGMRDRALLETLYGTGIRRSECLRLDVGDLDLGRETLLVRDGKGRKDRVVPVPGRAASALDVYLRDVRSLFHKNPRETALFLTCFGTRPGKSILDLIVRQHGRAARIARSISPHALRHACATHLLQGGASVRHVQELLGHKSLQTTAIYTRVALRDLREVVARCHPRREAVGARARKGRRKL